MQNLMKCFWPVLTLLLVFTALDWTLMSHSADARARGGGRSFSMPAQRSAPANQMQQNRGAQRQQPGAGSFGRGFLGGLAGAGLGALLFGSMFGMGGTGPGLLPLLLLLGAGYFFWRRFMRNPSGQTSEGYGPPGQGAPFGYAQRVAASPSFQDIAGPDEETTGLAAIRRTDPGFDEAHFLEVASDVFFKIQAGWTRRDFAAIRHLLGSQLAGEYEGHFRDMAARGQLNKLENISIRKVAIADAGSDGREDYVTVLFTANLLDYTVDERTGAVLEGSTSQPVKFAEEWTWARPVHTDNWLLERIQEVQA